MIRQLASTGEPDALYCLAEMTWRGGMVEQEPIRARILYGHAASLGHPAASIITTNLMASGIAGPRDWQGALGRLRSEGQRDAKRSAILTLINAMNLNAAGETAALPTGEVISQEPIASVFRALFSSAECLHLLNVARSNFRPSLVFDTERKLVRDRIRTSDGATIHWLLEDPAVHALNRRISKASASNYENGEALQVLRYNPGQEYKPHFDFLASTANGRMMTGLVYLNEAFEGGATSFVRTDVRFKGSTGDMLLFNNAARDGGPDLMAEHAGLPVTRGTKYLATRWIRDSRWIP